MCDDEGNRHEGEQIPKLFLKHFEDFLGKSSPVQDLDVSNNLFHSKLDFETAERMVRDVTDEEVKIAMF